jgi:hypothetical protein
MMAAFKAGKLDEVLGFWSPDAVMHIPGKHQLSGSYRGREAIGQALVKFGELSGWTLDLEPLDVVDANAFKLDERGRFAECWWLPDDQTAFDRFWG